MRRSEAATTRRATSAAALALATLLASCTSSASEGAPSTSRPTTTTEPRPPAGTRLDAAGLPAPVSNLQALGDVVTYLAPRDAGDLELVGVDPRSGGVAWRHDAALALTNDDVTLEVTALDDVVPFVRRTSGGTRYALDGAEADGDIRWSVPIGRPLGFAYACDAHLCIETIDGPVRVDPKTGDHETGRDAGTIVGTALSSDTEPSLQRVGHGEAYGGEEILSAPRFGAHPLWTVRLLEVLGTDDLTWQARGATRFGDQWVVTVYRERSDDLVDGWNESETDDLVSLAVGDGSVRWRRDDVDFCALAGAEDQILACRQAEVPGTDGGYRIAEVAALDPVTGADRIRIPLEPYDPEEGGAYAVTGPDRMLMITPTGVQEVDLAAGTARPADRAQVGWCRRRGDLPLVQDLAGTEYTVYSRAFGRPCALDGTTLDAKALVEPIVDGELPPVEGVSAVAVGPWVLWNDEGTLAGVVTEG